ncbi:hypothetical protein QEN19_000799 [Hanseniaspora menglaensis]
MGISNGKSHLKVFILQLNANNSVIKSNIREKIVSLLDSRSLNFSKSYENKLIVLPELSYHRYIFDKKQDAQQDDSLLEYFKYISKRYNSYVVSGFIEQNGEKKYNSSVCIYKDKVIHVHRKKHLYYTDEIWAEEGENFSTFKMKLDEGKKEITCSMGICMDVNPYKFEAPFEKYEYASFCEENSVDLAVLPTAWTHQMSVLQGESINSDSAIEKRRFLAELREKHPWLGNPELKEDNEIKNLQYGSSIKNTGFLFEPSFDTLNYWYSRFKPMHNSANKYLLFCDKTGLEGDVLYAGSSSCMHLDSGQVEVKGCLTTGVESLLEITLDFKNT